MNDNDSPQLTASTTTAPGPESDSVFITERELEIFRAAQKECLGCAALLKATVTSERGHHIPAKAMERYMANHLDMVRGAEQRGEHVELVPPRPQEGTPAPQPGGDPLAAAGIRIKATKTAPKKAGKTPRDVWEVYCPGAYDDLMRDLGARYYAGRWSFFKGDPTDTIRKELATYEPTSFADRVAAKNDRSLARAERRHEHAEKARDRADASFGRADRISQRFEFGQPILLGHHSERGARRDQARMHAGMQKGVEETRLAELHESRARGSERRVERQENLSYLQNRVEEAERTLRDIARKLDGTSNNGVAYGKPATGAWRDQLLRQLKETTEQLTYWKGRIAEKGGVTLGPGNVKVGDYVLYHGRWQPVRRVNKKTVSLPHFIGKVSGEEFTWTVRYADLHGHRTAEAMATAQDGESRAAPNAPTPGGDDAAVAPPPPEGSS